MAIAARQAVFDVDELVHEDRVHRRLYTDPAIFDAEMHLIFERTWVLWATTARSRTRATSRRPTWGGIPSS